jgi:PKD repeat protein
VLLLVVATPVAGAPAPKFTIRKIQGEACVAPCAVHFDAIGNGSDQTTDPEFDREFHSLHFQWDFGDPGAGTWSVSGESKEKAVGAIAGHLYERPGSYTVRLAVVNPGGESARTSQNLVVTDPDAAFSAAHTYCFANDDLDWSGCPLDCAGGDDNCTVTRDFDMALDGGDGCSGSDDCGRISTTKQRLLFRRGDRFAQDATPSLFDSTAPGLVTAFGDAGDPDPVVTGGGAFFAGGDGWTIASFEADRSAGYVFDLQNSGITTGFTVYDVYAHGYSRGCFDSFRELSNTSWSQRIANIELQCRWGVTGNGNDRYLWGEYTLTMGGYSDDGGIGWFALRTGHQRWSVIQHLRLSRPAAGHNTLQFRAWDHAAGAARGTEDNKWNIISDNQFVNGGGSSAYTMRICQDSGCNCPMGCDLTGNVAVENEDLIVERNLFRFDATPPTGTVTFGIEAWGGDLTFRNNLADYRGGMTGVALANRFVTARGSAHPNASNDDDIHVYNNTVYFDEAHPGDFTFCGDVGAGGGLFCRNNLLYAPNHKGAFRAATDGFVASNNLAASSNPFVGPMPAPGSTDADDFRIASPNPSIIDAGYRFSLDSDRHRWVHDDAYGGCRPGPAGASFASWDIGAHEVGAAPCSAGATRAPLATPVLP